MAGAQIRRMSSETLVPAPPTSVEVVGGDEEKFLGRFYHFAGVKWAIGSLPAILARLGLGKWAFGHQAAAR